MNELKLGGTYRHYKTDGLYIPMQLVKNTGDGQNDKLMVLYYSLQAKVLFVRPLDEFVADVTVTKGHADGRDFITPRFKLVA